MGMGTVTVYKSGNRFLINVPKNVIISENIKVGDLVDITLKNTGRQKEKRSYSFKKKVDTLKVTPTTPVTPAHRYPPEVQTEAIRMKKMGMTKESILQAIENSEAYETKDLSPDTLKKIE